MVPRISAHIPGDLVFIEDRRPVPHTVCILISDAVISSPDFSWHIFPGGLRMSSLDGEVIWRERRNGRN
jgi:hypothetical protein